MPGSTAHTSTRTLLFAAARWQHYLWCCFHAWLCSPSTSLCFCHMYCPHCSLKTQVSLIYPPEELGAACVFFAHTMLGIEPVTPDGSPFCEYARITAERIEGKAAGWALLGFALICLLATGGSCLVALKSALPCYAINCMQLSSGACSDTGIFQVQLQGQPASCLIIVQDLYGGAAVVVVHLCALASTLSFQSFHLTVCLSPWPPPSPVLQRSWSCCCQCTPQCCCHKACPPQLSPASSMSHLLPQAAQAYSCSTTGLWWFLQSRCSRRGSCSSSRSSGRTCRSLRCQQQRKGSLC